MFNTCRVRKELLTQVLIFLSKPHFSKPKPPEELFLLFFKSITYHKNASTHHKISNIEINICITLLKLLDPPKMRTVSIVIMLLWFQLQSDLAAFLNEDEEARNVPKVFRRFPRSIGITARIWCWPSLICRLSRHCLNCLTKFEPLMESQRSGTKQTLTKNMYTAQKSQNNIRYRPPFYWVYKTQ